MSVSGPSWCNPLPGEAPLAFVAFRLYRDLWAPTRSVEDVALELSPTNEDVTLKRCLEWHEAYKWDARAAEYDAWRDRRDVARRARLADMRAGLADHEGLIGLDFLRAAAQIGARLARDSDDVSATDAVRLARAGREMILRGGSENDGVRNLGDRLDSLSSDDLGDLLGILERAGIDLGEIS